MRKHIIGALAFLAAASASHASITLETQFASLFEADGSTQIGAGKIGLLVADTDGTGITNALNSILTEGTFLGGTSGDLIVSVFTSINNVAGHLGTSGFFDTLNITYSGNFDAGDDLYLLWFPTITTAGVTVLEGTSYGVYRSSVVNTASGSDIAFIAPPDGGAYTLASYLDTIETGSGVTPEEFTANFTAVPEPATAAMLAMVGIGGLLFMMRRRRS
jgi:hypothetical protein